MLKNRFQYLGQVRRFAFGSAILVATSLLGSLVEIADAQDTASSSSVVAEEPVVSKAGQVVAGPPVSQHARAERDISLGIFGQITATRTSNFSETESGSNGYSNTFFYAASTSATPGALFTYHEQRSPWLGYKANLSYTRMTEKSSLVTQYFYGNPPSSGTYFQQLAVQSDLIELSGAYTAESPAKGRRLRLFSEVGGGALLFNPNRGDAPVSKEFRAMGLAGVGVDWRLTNHLGLRAEYRGLVTRYPDWGPLPSFYHQTQRPLTLISEPTLSLVYRFGKTKAGK